MDKILPLLLSFYFFYVGSSGAQTHTVSGTVTSTKDGKPLSGVTVSVIGSSVATQTDHAGHYSIQAASGATLQFAFLSYASLTRQVTASLQEINVALAQDEGALEQVIVTGYGAQTRREFTGASAQISGAEIADRPVQSFAQGLTGHATGVNIVQPNGLLNNPPVIRVRGLSSISLNSFPLIVVDGIPILSDNVSENAAPNNPLADINPSDIESIDILKDAASASIYGSRAAAGVLVITTKRGKPGKTRVNYDAWVGVSNATRLPNILNAQQFMDSKNTAIDNAYVNNPDFGIARNAFRPSYHPDGSLVDINWQDHIYRSAASQNHHLAVSGGNESTTYYASASISDQDGFLRANNFKRRSGRINMDHQVNNWWKLFGNVSYNNTVNNAPSSGSFDGGAFNASGLGRIAMAQTPNVPLYNPDGSYHIELTTIGRGNNLIQSAYAHPEVLINYDQNTSESNRLLANVGTSLELMEGLTFKSSYTWDIRQTEDLQFWNPLNGDGRPLNGRAFNHHARANNWNWINTLQYVKTINDDHHINMLVGSDAQQVRIAGWGAIRENLVDNFVRIFQGDFLTNLPAANHITDFSFAAYLGSVSYNYRNKYFISGNFRRDGNSALAPGNQWGNFGGVSAGWTISEEDFFQSSDLAQAINNLRLRASWGRTGNGNMNSFYSAYSLYALGVYGASTPSIQFNQAANADLRWETSQQTNIGLDVGLVENRLNLEVNWYQKNVDNMILGVPQAPSKGIPGDDNTILSNVGAMYNRGWEFALNAVPVRTEHFTWSANLNFSTLKNEVTALAAGNLPILGYTSVLELTNVTQVGLSAAQIYGVQTDGINPANGARIFIDNQGRRVQYEHLRSGGAYTVVETGEVVSAGSVTSATQALGNTIPTWFGGFNNNFAYKKWDLALNFTFSGGNYIYNGTRAGLLDQRTWNNSTEILNAWTPDNRQTDIPKVVFTDNVSNGSSYLIAANVERGDFLRLQTATLGYTLPANVFKNRGLSSVRFYLQSNNLFLLTRYSGVDPEISTNGNSNIASGIERNSVPQARQFSFGVNVGF